MNNFLLRTISGSLFVVSIVGSLILGRISFLIVFLGLMIAAMYEFYSLSLRARIRPQFLFGILLGVSAFLWSYFYASGRIEPITIFGIFPLIISVYILELYRNHQRPFHNIAYTLLGVFYIALPFSLLNFIVLNGSSFRLSYSYEILLGYFILIWANDTGAYLFGMSIGKHRLFPRISPKKSWEGFIGGILVTGLVAWVISMFFDNISVNHWIAIGFISAIMGVFGDLVESMFKRSLGVKDSGKFLPGHGGLLDRFDAVLLSIPVVYAYLEVMMIV
ncbi:MAG: phosphatidate cytidylyltransferase [Tenuifilaceae bacterium]